MIASGSSRDGLETEFGLRAAADVKNTGGEAFTGFAAGHFLLVVQAGKLPLQTRMEISSIIFASR